MPQAIAAIYIGFMVLGFLALYVVLPAAALFGSLLIIFACVRWIVRYENNRAKSIIAFITLVLSLVFGYFVLISDFIYSIARTMEISSSTENMIMAYVVFSWLVAIAMGVVCLVRMYLLPISQHKINFIDVAHKAYAQAKISKVRRNEHIIFAKSFGNTEFEKYIFQEHENTQREQTQQDDYSEFRHNRQRSNDDFSYRKAGSSRAEKKPYGVDKHHPDDIKYWNIVNDPNASESERQFALRRVLRNEGKRRGDKSTNLRVINS